MATPPKRGRDSASHEGADESPYFEPPRNPQIFHFGNEFPFPDRFDEREFPRMKYRSRGREVKTAVHWGQRKLLMSEIQLLSLYCQPKVKHWVVYVGAAPGSHLLLLDELFDKRHEWELIDPGKWDDRLRKAVDSGVASYANQRILLRNEYFDNGTAYRLVARRLEKAGLPFLGAVYLNAALEHSEAAGKILTTSGHDADAARTSEIPIHYEQPLDLHSSAPGLNLLLRVACERVKMLFVSDVRSGSESSALQPGADLAMFERHVAENSRAQEAWVDILNPTFAMLKFRLPYSYIQKWDHELKRNKTVPSGFGSDSSHHCGDVLLPIWTRPTSTECRLVIPQYAEKRLYNHQAFEDCMFFFNATIRERVHFDHCLANHPWVTHQYDGSAEVHVLSQYLRLHTVDGGACSVDELGEKVRSLSDAITRTIGSSFERAVANRDAIHLEHATRGGWLEETHRRLQEAETKRNLPVWRRNARCDELGEIIGTQTFLSALREMKC